MEPLSKDATFDMFRTMRRKGLSGAMRRIQNFIPSLRIVIRLKDHAANQLKIMFCKRLAQLKEELSALHEKLKEESPTAELTDQDAAAQQEVADEWDKYSDDDDMWKKKNVYD